MSAHWEVITPSGETAFRIAEQMAFKGYSVKLSKEPGDDWIVVATKTGEVNQHAKNAQSN